MIRHAKLIALHLAIFGGAFAGSLSLSKAITPHGRGENVRPVLSRQLPRMDGSQLELKTVEGNYAPGGTSAAHSHPCPVAFVIEGAIRSQVNAEQETIYKAGEAFYEAPNGKHSVSANASETEPAKLLTIFVCDRTTPVTVDLPEAKENRRYE